MDRESYITDSLMNSPRRLDRIFVVDVDIIFFVELQVVVKPLGEVRRGAILTRYQYLDLWYKESSGESQLRKICSPGKRGTNITRKMTGIPTIRDLVGW